MALKSMAILGVALLCCRFPAVAGIPSDAVRLRYIESQGDTYIDTGYRATNTDIVRMGFRLWSLEGYPSGIFDARDNAMSGKHYTAMLPDMRHVLRVGRCTSNESFSWASDSLQANMDYDLLCDFDEGVVSVNGDVCIPHIGAGNNPAEIVMDNTLLVLAYRNSGSPAGYLRARLYSFTVSNRFGEKKVDLIPCRLATGDVGMYDLVRDVFIGSGVAGHEFVAGPEEVSLVVQKYDSVSGQVTLDVQGDISRRCAIYAAYGAVDGGCVSIDSWPNTMFVGDVEPGETTVVVNVPDSADIGNDVIRFFLVDCLGTYEGRAVKSIRSKERTQWIDTGVAPDSTTTTRMEVRIYKASSANYNCQFGVANKYFMFRNTEALFYSWFSAYQSVPLPQDIRDDQIHILQYGPEGGFIDGTQYISGRTGQGSTDLTVTLFGRRETAATVGKLDDSAIYSTQMWKGGELVRDFRPCVKDGVAGLYDNVNRRFYENCGSGVFTVEEFPSAAEICLGVTDKFELSRSVRSVEMRSFDVKTGAYTLAISRGETQKCLYVQHAERGPGGTNERWNETLFLAEIAPDVTAFTGTVPTGLLTDGAVRFALGAYVPERMRVGGAKGVESVTTSVLIAPEIGFTINPETMVLTVRMKGNHGSGRILCALDSVDHGELLADWPRIADVGVVSSSTDTLEVALPDAWKDVKSPVSRVFYAAGTTNCPYDYEVESIISDSTQWIDTGVAPDPTTTTEISALLYTVPDSSYEPQFGIANTYFMFRNSEPKLYYSWFECFPALEYADFARNIRDNGVHELKLGPDGGFVDGEQIIMAMPSATGWTPLTLTLFARRTTDTKVEKMDRCAIRSAKITKRGRIVRDFTPCVKNGEVGLFDRVAGVFYANGNSAGHQFQAGDPKMCGLKIESCDILGFTGPKKIEKGLLVIFR